MNRMSPSQRRKRARRDREGVVLLITAFVLMLVSATAVYAVQQGVFEVRAAGAARQALRTKYVSESFVMAGLACIEDGACVENHGGISTGADDVHLKYGLPPVAGDNSKEIFTLVQSNFAQHFAAEIAPSDQVLSGGGLVTAYTPGYSMIIERWKIELPAQGAPDPVYRYVASCFGETQIAGDATASGETRCIHESVSISRAYYTKR
jgi:hypothetical protein